MAVEEWVIVCAPESLDFVEGSSECLAAADTLEVSLPLAVDAFVWASEATFWAFLLATRAVASTAKSAAPSSGIPLPSPTPVFPLSPGLRVSLGLRAVLKKDKPLSSVLLFPRDPFDGAAVLSEETPMLEDLRLVIEELLLDLPPVALSSTAFPGLLSALLAALALEGGPPWLTFLSDTALASEDSRLVLLSAALVLPEAELFSTPPLGDVLL